MGFISNHKKLFVVIVILICAAAIFFSSIYRTQPTLVEDALGYAVTPIQKLMTNISGWVESKIVFFSDIAAIESENQRLLEEIEALTIDNARLKQVELENIKLTKLFEIDQKYPDYPKVGAYIIGKDPGNWYDNFIIDKGRKDGLSGNMVVIASGGLVGRIMESGYNYSLVKALIDDSSAVSAKSVRTEDIGIVRGDMKLRDDGLCRMERIDINAEIIIGDEIVTSNLGDIYPPGITIGFVKEITVNADGLTKEAIIEPQVDFKHLETVLVIKQILVKELIDEAEGEE